MNNVFTKTILRDIKQFALNEMRERVKDPHTTDDQHQSLCWGMGVQHALIKSGFKVTITKGNDVCEIWQST